MVAGSPGLKAQVAGWPEENVVIKGIVAHYVHTWIVNEWLGTVWDTQQGAESYCKTQFNFFLCAHGTS